MNFAMANSKTEFSRLKRYCNISSCENVRGTFDKNISFFSLPPRGSAEWKTWMMILFATESAEISFNKIYCKKICQLHFKPNDLQESISCGITRLKLKPGVVPMPIKTPIEVVKVKSVQKVALVDINDIQNVADTDSRLETLNDCRKTSSNAANSCANCVDIDEQLTQAKLVIKKLLQRVNELKRSVQENDCEKCELCRKSLSTNELSAHSCEDGLMAVEVIKFETPDDIMETITDRFSSAEPLHDRPETEQPDLSDLSNELYPSASINMAQNPHQLPKHKFFLCGKCEESFETGKELQIHLQKYVHTFVEPEYFECFICKRDKFEETHMRKHLKRHRIRNYSKCDICKKLSDTILHLCGKNKDVQCEYCPKRFTTTKKLQNHLNRMHENSRRLYNCEKCHEFFPMIYLKDCHQASHSNSDFTLQCDMCPKKFSTQKYLDCHKKTHMCAKSFLCEECGKGFSTERNLEFHKISSIHSAPTFACHSCPKKFFTPSGLRRHSNIHSGANYVCMHCDKVFNTIEGHRSHIKRHNRTEADRRFACKQCPMKFFNSKHLDTHKFKHIGIKQFHCRHCDRSFKYSGDLNKHVRTHFVDGKIHECSICQMRFKYLAELQQHTFQHYKAEEAVEGDQTDGEMSCD